MTDNEIIKALECCGLDGDCVTCPFYDLEFGCNENVFLKALDLINRQKDESEKWKGGYMTQKQEIANLEIELKVMRGAANSYKAEIERLSKVRCHFPNDNYCKVVEINEENEILKEENQRLIFDLKISKAEAYKELAERLKEDVGSFGKHITVEHVDNLVKEMVGE